MLDGMPRLIPRGFTLLEFRSLALVLLLIFVNKFPPQHFAVRGFGNLGEQCNTVSIVVYRNQMAGWAMVPHRRIRFLL